MRKHLYKWHRALSLIIALPVLLWAASGFMHPLMTNIRPRVATQSLSPRPVDTGKINISLQEALRRNAIDRFSNVRIVAIGGQPFYQVKLAGQPRLQYLSTQNGRRLPKGDELYARWLARHFLEGPAKEPRMHPLLASVQTTGVAPVTAAPALEEGGDDCCRNATSAVMEESSGARITGVELVEAYGDEYSYINRLLPVYRVGFDRADGIRVYVETGQDRFAFAVDNKRAAFDKVFTFFHTLGWLDALGSFKHVVALLLMAMTFCTAVLGIYIFFITKTKKPKGNELLKARRNHRWVSIVASLFTLMFSFSGGYHAFSSIAPKEARQRSVTNDFKTEEAALDISRLQAAVGAETPVANIGLVRYDNDVYWQVYPAKQGMRTAYVRAGDDRVLEGGEEKYARYLAGQFSGQSDGAITAVTRITKFNSEYGFISKRLPVWKIDYTAHHHQRCYVETSTGTLAMKTDDIDVLEGYSFGLLHKHEFWAWAGKPVKDASTMLAASLQILMVAVGLVLYMKSRRRKKVTAGTLRQAQGDNLPN